VRLIHRGWSTPIDVLGARAENLDALLMEAKREVVRNLAAHADDDAVGLLPVAEVHHRLERNLFEVELVADVVVGAHRLGVVVEHDRFEAGIGCRLNRVHTAPIELYA
jgi:hypothetical protein